MHLTHRYWTGPAHPLDIFGANAVSSVAPGLVVNWTDDTLPEECLEEAKRAEGKVKEEDAIRHRTNVVRWWLLLKYGGYTVHHDLIPITPFKNLPFPVTAAHDNFVRCTSFLGFPAGDPLVAEILEEIRKAPLNNIISAPFVSGEQLLSKLAGDIPRLILPWDGSGNRLPEDPWAVFLRFPKERHRPNIGQPRPVNVSPKIVSARVVKAM